TSTFPVFLYLPSSALVLPSFPVSAGVNLLGHLLGHLLACPTIPHAPTLPRPNAPTPHPRMCPPRHVFTLPSPQNAVAPMHACSMGGREAAWVGAKQHGWARSSMGGREAEWVGANQHGMAGKREGRVKEQYPWASHRWLDSLLRLPAQRQRLFLAHRLATSPLSNALGGVVFLGTPFYMKSWERNGMVLLLATTAVSVGVTFVVMWGYVLLWRVVVLAIAGQLASTTTPSYVPFSLATAVLIFAIISVAMELWRSTAFYSGNIYHSPGFDWSHAMSALVIHAGKLDEASLALSTEPIARAYIFPQLASMLKLPFWKPLPRRPVTRKCSEWTLYISNTARILMWNVIFILPAAAVALLSRVLAPVVISMVRNVIVTVSFGLSPKELSFASVFVDERLDLGLASQHIEHWNVQKLLALAKTRSLQGELMEGYEDDTCDMGEALFGDGLPEEGVPREGIPRKKVPVTGVRGEGLIGREGKVEERKEEEGVGGGEVRVRRQGDADERSGGEGEGSPLIDSTQTDATRPQQEGCIDAAEPLDSRARLSGTLGSGPPVEPAAAALQQVAAGGGEEGVEGRAACSSMRSVSRFRRRVTFTERSLRQGERRAEGGEDGGEEGGEEGGDGKEKRGGEGSSSEGAGNERQAAAGSGGEGHGVQARQWQQG
ncbi:unnamed protein product, partial [Closterium sp. NIES-65]